MPHATDSTAVPPIAPPPIPAPRFASAWAALVYAVAALTLSYPVFAGKILLPRHSDQFLAGYAFREYAAESLKAGQGFPEWNAFLNGGLPYIAAMHGDIFYPTFLLRMLLPADMGMTWGFIIHLFLAGFFTYAFLRTWGLGFYPALIGGLAYMMSGPIAGLASPGHDGKMFVSALLPLALWMLVRLIRDGRTWAWGVFALVVGLAFLTPHPQLFQYLLLASGTFALYVAISSSGAGGAVSRRMAAIRLGSSFGAVVLGVIMGAVQYVPALFEYEKWSPRAGGREYEHAVSYSMPIEETINGVVPEFTGMLGNYWGRNGIHHHSEYAGVVVLVLAGAGMFVAGRRRGFRWFWLATFVVSLFWAFGGHTPFYKLVYHLVPYTKYLRAPSTMMFLSMFSLSVLAALGAERLLQADSTVKKTFYIGWAAGIAALALLILTGALPNAVAQGVGADIAARGYPPQQAPAVIDHFMQRASANQPQATTGALRALLFTLITLAVIWALQQRRVGLRAAAIGLAALIAIDLWITERRYWIFVPRAAELFASDPAIDSLKAATAREPGRVLTWAPDAIGFRSEFRDAMMGTNGLEPYDGLMVHRQRMALGYHGNELGRYQQLATVAMDQSPLKQVRSAAPLQPAFLRHENVQYLYTTVPDSIMRQLQAPMQWSAPARLIVGPVKNGSGSTVYLYRLPGENPAAVVASVMVKGTDEQALATVLDNRFDARRAAILDTAAAVQAAQPTTVPEPSSVQARVTRYESGAINVELGAPVPTTGSALVVSENFYPGWRATIGGQNADVVRANYNLIGVPLPAGAREVQLRFVDDDYATGKMVTIVALVATLVAIVAGVLIDRRASSAPISA